MTATSPPQSPVLPRGLPAMPAMPAASLDPVLDAASNCFVKYGVRRTSVQDIATEMGVNRTTVYRQVGSIEQIIQMLAVRDSYRFIARIPGLTSGKHGRDALVEVVAGIVEAARTHPVLAKVLEDEPDIAGSLVARQLPELLEPAMAIMTPLVASIVQGEGRPPQDPAILAEWVLRVGTTLVLIDSPHDLRAFLSAVLVPALEPADAAAAL